MTEAIDVEEQAAPPWALPPGPMVVIVEPAGVVLGPEQLEPIAQGLAEALASVSGASPEDVPVQTLWTGPQRWVSEVDAATATQLMTAVADLPVATRAEPVTWLRDARWFQPLVVGLMFGVPGVGVAVLNGWTYWQAWSGVALWFMVGLESWVLGVWALAQVAVDRSFLRYLPILYPRPDGLRTVLVEDRGELVFCSVLWALLSSLMIGTAYLPSCIGPFLCALMLPFQMFLGYGLLYYAIATPLGLMCHPSGCIQTSSDTSEGEGQDPVLPISKEAADPVALREALEDELTDLVDEATHAQWSQESMTALALRCADLKAVGEALIERGRLEDFYDFIETTHEISDSIYETTPEQVPRLLEALREHADAGVSLLTDGLEET